MTLITNIWYTAKWGNDLSKLRLGLAGQTGHADFGYEYSDQLSSYLRYDELDPDLTVTGNVTRRVAVAVVLRMYQGTPA